MSSVSGRGVMALLVATTLALASAGPAAAAQPTGEWVTWFATDQLPAGTWPVGTYYAASEHPFFLLHETWTLPAPAGERYTAAPLNGPYEVSAEAPLYPATVLLRLGFLQAMTSGTFANPVCSSVLAINPDQPTRIVIGESNKGTPMTQAEWQKEMATTTLTAAPSAGIEGTLPMTPIKTEALTTVEGSCQFTIPAGTAIAPCPPDANCVQASSGTGTQATLIADPGSTWTPGFGASYFGSLIPGGNCTSGDPLNQNGVLGFLLSGQTQTKVIVLALDPALVTHGIGQLKVCWNQATPFTSLSGAKVNTGDLPSCQGGNQVPPCVLSRTSGQHNVAFLSILAPANDPSDPFAYGHF